MISLSKHAEMKPSDRNPFAAMPLRLLDEGERGVSRLEFFPLERPSVVERVESDGVEALLQEEAASLDVQLRSQAEEIAAAIELARSEAREEARCEWEEKLEKGIAEERTTILRTSEAFFRERGRYFAGVEAEVVKLALAIAERVLHREAQLDPLLLAGVVRVALEKVAEDSATVLRVPAGTTAIWREVFSTNAETSLQIVGDERLGGGECVLETNVGRVELGVSAQLEEIERGFFDLMQQRPA